MGGWEGGRPRITGNRSFKFDSKNLIQYRLNMKEALVLLPQTAYDLHILDLQSTDELETRRIKASSTQH